MDESIEPDVYVMTWAWYGVVPTGAQAAVAIRLLANLSSSDHPDAIEVLSKDIYVDNVNPGAETEAEWDKQISSTHLVLQKGGFGFKYVVYSGIAPGEKASPDGMHVKLLRYKWNSEHDILYPGFAKINLNKKVRGAKKLNVLPVVTLEDAGRHMNSVTLTRHMVVLILAELYDPCGFWEPWKLQLKLMSQSLASMDWDEDIRQRTRTPGNSNYLG